MILQEQSIKGEIKTINLFGQYYAEVWKGYFVASNNGSHTFRGVGDDSFAVYISN